MLHFHPLSYVVAVPQVREMDAVTMGIVNKSKAILFCFGLCCMLQFSCLNLGKLMGTVLRVKVCVAGGKHTYSNRGPGDMQM